jgi:hypothetical protein
MSSSVFLRISLVPFLLVFHVVMAFPMTHHSVTVIPRAIQQDTLPLRQAWKKRPLSFLSRLFLTPNDNNDAGYIDVISSTRSIATIFVTVLSLVSSLGVVWSEYAIFQTGCGPLLMPDWLERSCYLGVLVVSSLSVFVNIVLPEQGGLAGLLLVNTDEDTAKSNIISSGVRNWLPLLQVSEVLALLVVLGAVIVLTNQSLNGETMDGMSGIDIDKCRARFALETAVLSGN